MATSAEQMRAWQGPAILSFGYRPFFLAAGLCAAFSMPLWIMMYSGNARILSLAGMMVPVDLHVHSMLFSYLWAVIAGFLMTAIPNWTGRFPIVGWPLLGLSLLWLFSFFAFAFSAVLPLWLILVLDLLFPLAFTAVIAREIIFGKNWRNLKVLMLVSLLFIANLIFDEQALFEGEGAYGLGTRLALAVAIMLIGIVGGRIVPSFTRNYLAKRGEKNLPVPHNRFDQVTMIVTGIVMVTWIICPDWFWTGVLCLIAALFHFVRLWRWRPQLTFSDPLVWVLHLGYVFIPLGFVAMGFAICGVLAGGSASAQHIWMAGGVGMMTLAVMTRAALGHSGRPLQVGWPVATLYILLFVSVLLRFIGGLLDNNVPLLHMAATCWTLTFLGFVFLYWNILTRPRLTRATA